MARIVQYKISFMEKRQESNSNRSSLGLDISIAAYKVIAIDPPKVRQLKEAIKKKAILLVLYDAVKAGKAIQAFEQPVSFTPTKFMYKKYYI